MIVVVSVDGFAYSYKEVTLQMKLLIIGGTRFVGRAITQEALDTGHEVTLFNRGKSNAGLFPEADELVGDRDGGLDILRGRRWDAVIDTSGYVPRLVRDSARLLAAAVEHYTFISTISTYASFAEPGINEDSPQGTLEDETAEEVNDTTYELLKVLCEQALNEEMPDRVLHVRPTLIVGPYEEDDLFTYWVDRVAQGGEILVPGTADASMQFIDARDLATWVAKATEQRLTGPYITTGPDHPLTMSKILQTCRQVSDSDAVFTYVGDDFLLDKGLKVNDETPWWIPASHKGYGLFNNQKAVAAGLAFRPLDQTVKDMLDWLQIRPADYEWRSGLRPEEEQNLLAEWHSQ